MDTNLAAVSSQTYRGVTCVKGVKGNMEHSWGTDRSPIINTPLLLSYLSPSQQQLQPSQGGLEGRRGGKGEATCSDGGKLHEHWVVRVV